MSLLPTILSLLLAVPGPSTRLIAAPAGGPAVTRPEPAPAVTSLRVILGCAACGSEVQPMIGLLWSPEAGPGGASTSEGFTMGLRCVDWDSGAFEVSSGADREQRLVGERLADGSWAVEVPLGGRGLPFRLAASLPGHVAIPGAAWPAASVDLAVKVAFEPVTTFLEESPALDPALTEECQLVIPSDQAPPHVLEVDGEPRAWLFQAAGSEAWTFQFVRPGGSLLERVAVQVAATREAGDLVVRLPLQPLVDAQRAGASRQPGTGHVVLRGAGVLDLAACPRVPLRLAE